MVAAQLRQDKGDASAVVGAMSELVRQSPDNPAMLVGRAAAHRDAGDIESALADIDAAIRLAPTEPNFYMMRANILRSQGRSEEGIKAAAAVAAAAPENIYAQVVSANIYSAFGKDADAMAAYDRALAIRPEPYVYINRAERRPKEDVAGRRADIDAALKLNPDFSEGVAAKAKLLTDAGDHAGAIATYSAALERSPGDPFFLNGRGMAYARSGDAQRARTDFDLARAKATNATLLNNICWAKAVAGVALETALQDCNAALAQEPGAPNYLDSRALVLLRLGRIDEAIADYDGAIAKRPNFSASLFGRAIAWARKGDRAKSDADAAAALKLDADVKKYFADYGVTMPGAQ